jgi:hypothetical protein
MPLPQAILNSRPAKWEQSRRPDGTLCAHVRVFVPLAAKEVAVVLQVSEGAARQLLASTPGYRFVGRIWICPN